MNNNRLNNLPEIKSAPEKWYLRWWMVAVWLFVAGPFGFPALWKSKDISRFWKWFWTIAILVLTVYVCWASWKIVETIIKQFRDLGVY
jgi:hypothetical protein